MGRMSDTPTPDGRPDDPVTSPSAPLVLQYPCGEAPAPGEVREVAPGVLWLRMPLPFALNHINLWAVADEDEHGTGWAVVDTGTKTPEAMAAWRQLTSPTGPLAATPQGARITRVFCTHMHPDHVGMAGWLTRKFQCRLWMTRLEYLTCRTLVADTGRDAPEEAIEFYRRMGWSENALDVYRSRFGGYSKYMHTLPDSQVLPRISSNVSVFPTEPEADPLRDWIESIERLRGTLSDDLLVLPAHGDPFRGLHARLDRLAQGHEHGLQRLRRTLGESPKRTVEVFGALFARAIEGDSDLLGMATGEGVAHLNHLIARGETVRETGSDGVYHYRMA